MLTTLQDHHSHFNATIEEKGYADDDCDARMPRVLITTNVNICETCVTGNEAIWSIYLVIIPAHKLAFVKEVVFEYINA